METSTLIPNFIPPREHSPNRPHILCGNLIPGDTFLLSHKQQPLPQTIWDTHISHAPMSIVPTLQTITQPTQNDTYTMYNNSSKNTTLIEEDDNNGMCTTSAEPTTTTCIRRAWILGENFYVPRLHRVLPPYSGKISKLVRCTCKLHDNSRYKYKIHPKSTDPLFGGRQSD